jgi:predicted GNAT family acetyltransferase
MRMDPKAQQHIVQEQSEQRQHEREEARRRVQDGEEPWTEARGVLSVVEAVRDVAFPMDARELAYQVGDREPVVAEGHPIALRRILGKLKDDTHFESLKDFQTAVMRHWEGIRNLTVPPEQWPGRIEEREAGMGSHPANR